MIKCFLVAMMSLEDNKHALYQLLAHPKYALRGEGRGPCFRALGVGVPPRSLSAGSVFRQSGKGHTVSPALPRLEKMERTWVLRVSLSQPLHVLPLRGVPLGHWPVLTLGDSTFGVS